MFLKYMLFYGENNIWRMCIVFVCRFHRCNDTLSCQNKLGGRNLTLRNRQSQTQKHVQHILAVTNYTKNIYFKSKIIYVNLCKTQYVGVHVYTIMFRFMLRYVDRYRKRYTNSYMTDR